MSAVMSISRNPEHVCKQHRKLRIAIVTENFLPKVDGVTRTLARLLEHLRAEGHDAIVCGPGNGMNEYASYRVLGTFGIPLVVYPGLKLNFARPLFIDELRKFDPDVIHFVDPIWLGAQMLPLIQRYFPQVPRVSSYHTNIATYASLFGMPWLEKVIWKLTLNLHSRCGVVFAPSESTKQTLIRKGFKNVEIWSRGVDTTLFSPSARDDNLRASWGCTPKPPDLVRGSLVDLDAAPLLRSQDTPDAFASFGRSSRSVKAKDLQIPHVLGVDEDSFIRTPPYGPSYASSFGSEFTPPPSYDSLDGIPELPHGSFALPPPAVPSTLPSLRPHCGESKVVVLYVGRLSWEKNLHLLVEAFRLLSSSARDNSKLVFVGDGPARAELTGLCKRLKLNATFMGHQKGKRLAALYASSSIFAFPSFTETFGQVVLEALASGLPIVGLLAEGTSDLVTHGRTGFLLDVAAVVGCTGKEKSESLAGAGSIPHVSQFAEVMTPTHPAFPTCAGAYSALIEHLVNDRALRAAMGRHAQASASERTWNHAMDGVVRRYIDISTKMDASSAASRDTPERDTSVCKLLSPIYVRLIVSICLPVLLLAIMPLHSLLSSLVSEIRCV